jgi:hypothetical protein
MDKDNIRREIEERTEEFGHLFYGLAKVASELLNSLAMQLGVLWKHLAQVSRDT